MDTRNNIMGGNETETMHDWKPTHPPVSKAVRVAQEHADVARKVYDDYVDEMLNNGVPGIDWTEMKVLAKVANDADTALLEARNVALNCQHKNVSYQGSMHFSAGEVDDDIVEVCEDCGYLFSGTQEGGE